MTKNKQAQKLFSLGFLTPEMMCNLRSTSTVLAVLALLVMINSCQKRSEVSVVDSSHTQAVASQQQTENPAAPTSTGNPPPALTDTAAQKVNDIAAPPAGKVRPRFDARKASLHNLPPSSEEFVKQHYPAYKIVAATYDPLCGGAPAVDVAIRSKGKPNYSVIFRPDGRYVQQEEDVALSTAPLNVRDSVKKRYRGFSIAKQIERLIMADKSTQYEFDVSKARDKREVILNSAGVVVCEGKD